MTTDSLAKLRAALAAHVPESRPAFDPNAYPGMKITQAPAASTDLDEVVNEAFEAAAWPECDQPMPRASELSAEQRALAQLIASVPGVPLHRWAIPQASWARRRWLGLDPPGAVERHDLARALQAVEDADDEGASAAAILKRLPLAERLEAFGDLSLGAYRVDAPSLGELAPDELGDAARTWAPAFADRLLALFAPDAAHADRGDRQSPEPALTALVCDALVAARVPIEERWDRFVPLDAGVLATLPPERRDAVIVRALGDEFTKYGLREGLELVTAFPSVALVDHLIARADECTQSLSCPPRRQYLARLRDAVAAQAELAARVDARLAELPPLPTLHCTRKLYPTSAGELSPGLRTMLGVLGQGWENDDGSLVTLDDDDEPQFAERLEFVSAFEIADERGAAYEALLYMDEDGSVCRANTTKQVMMFSQMNVSWNVDDTVAEALHAIVRERPPSADFDADADE
jgi:hypothetical protein